MILIVDDNRDAAEVLQAMFATENLNTRVAYNGAGAVAAAQEEMPRTIVMDIGMPGMDGYETARQIRGLPGGDQPTLVAVTGWGQEEARKKSAAAGFDHHLVKPVDFNLLKKCL
ncbi:MAG: response regulator [Burkholderiaceae bacterium]|jgi:CheY-like chemotaxis protein